MIHEFQPSNENGVKGEMRIAKAHPNLFTKYYDGNAYDLVVIPTKQSLEVKTETKYSLTSSPNFFIELYSNDITFPLGGPSRALKDGVDYYLHYFIQNDRIFWFGDLQVLVDRCNDIMRSDPYRYSYKRLSVVRNKSYNTLGFPMPRDSFKDLYVEAGLSDNMEVLINAQQK